MPEFFITEPEIYEGNVYEALPQLFSMWSVFFGTALAIYFFTNVPNPLRVRLILNSETQRQRAHVHRVLLEPGEETRGRESWPQVGQGKSFWYQYAFD